MTPPAVGTRVAATVRQLVLQPTPYCNIDCRYCYLSTRGDRRRMTMETVRAACCCLFDSPFAGETLEVIWHAGEPLVLPVDYYRDAFAVVAEEAPPGCRVRHSIQTNGLLIDEAWCDLFLEHRVILGLSIDGPAWLHDRQRVTRGGRGTHARVMEAVGLLNRREVPFRVIAVLTRESLDHPDELYTFFEGLGARSVGFNVEETEAGHVSATMGAPDLVESYTRFLRRIGERCDAGSLPVRELTAARRALLRPEFAPISPEATPLSILSVDVDGGLATFSPELLGVELPGRGRFRFGNVAGARLAEVLDSASLREVADEIERGVQSCRAGCGYFSVCGGGAPANKFFENGSFAGTETLHCKTRIKSATLVVLEQLEGRHRLADPDHRHDDVGNSGVEPLLPRGPEGPGPARAVATCKPPARGRLFDDPGLKAEFRHA